MTVSTDLVIIARINLSSQIGDLYIAEVGDVITCKIGVAEKDNSFSVQLQGRPSVVRVIPERWLRTIQYKAVHIIFPGIVAHVLMVLVKIRNRLERSYFLPVALVIFFAVDDEPRIAARFQAVHGIRAVEH